MATKISRRSDVLPFRVMDVMAAAREAERKGRDIVHMEVGEPGRATPERALKAGIDAMQAGNTGYTLALGNDLLRARIAKYYGEAYNLDLNPERVIITTGSSAAFSLVFMACFDVGDRVAIVRPGYPAYGRIMQGLGLEAVDLHTTASERFQPTAEKVSTLSGVDGLLVASPSNPTGTVIDSARMAGLANACSEKGMRLISDEIYHRITFDTPTPTALGVSDDAVIINSFSKYYCMTGWRIGWMVVPENLVRPIERLAQNFFISPPTVSQVIALEIFSCSDELDAEVAQYRRSRQIVSSALRDAGVPYIAPADGAFYLYADMSPFTNDSEEFCRAMLEGAGVAAVTGIDFDEREGQRYVRFSISGSESEIEKAAARLRDWLPTQTSL